MLMSLLALITLILLYEPFFFNFFTPSMGSKYPHHNSIAHCPHSDPPFLTVYVAQRSLATFNLPSDRDQF